MSNHPEKINFVTQWRGLELHEYRMNFGLQYLSHLAQSHPIKQALASDHQQVEIASFETLVR